MELQDDSPPKLMKKWNSERSHDLPTLSKPENDRVKIQSQVQGTAASVLTHCLSRKKNKSSSTSLPEKGREASTVVLPRL